MTKVFLSYARLDHDRARALYDELNALPDLDVWFDKVDLLPGARWKPAIRKAIRESRYFIALLSRRSTSVAGYRHSELRQAVEVMEQFPDEFIFLIPTRLEECEPPVAVLEELTYADLFPDWDAGVANLAKAMGVSAPRARSRSTKKKKSSKKKKRSTKKTAAKRKVKGMARRGADRRQSGEYDYNVGLVDLDVGLSELRSLARDLNEIQDFVYLTTSRLKPSRKALQSMEGFPQLNLNDLSSQFYAKIGPLEMDHAICITDRLLMFEENGDLYYNYLGETSPRDERITFGSIRGLSEQATEAGVSFQAALSYVLVSEFTSYFLDISYHNAIRACPLDFTEDHADMVKGLRKGQFCSSCLRKLAKNERLKNAVTAMLQWGR